MDELEVGAKERLRAAELLGRRYALFRDRAELSGALPVILAGEEEIRD